MEKTAITDLETAQATIIQLEKELTTKTNELHQQKEELEYTNSLLDEMMGELEQYHAELSLLKKSQPMSNDNINQVVSQDTWQETQNQLYQALELLEKYQQQLDKTMAVVEKLSKNTLKSQAKSLIKPGQIQRIYIRGCSRSGNTLMLYLCGTGFKNTHILSAEQIPIPEKSVAGKITIGKLPSPQLYGKEIIHQANTFLDQEDAAVIFMLRDPRDVLLSEHGQKPNQPWLRDSQRWIDSASLLKELSNHPRLIQVRYEDLINNPDQVQLEIARKINLEINIPFSECWQHFPKVDNANEKALKGVRPIDKERVGNWKNDQQKIEYVMQKLKEKPEIFPLMEYFGYEMNIGNDLNQKQDLSKKHLENQELINRQEIRNLVKINPNQLSVNEYESIVKSIIDKTPCNFLIFGIGKDSRFWIKSNTKGKTLFVANNQVLIDKMKGNIPNINICHVNYDTKLQQAQELLSRYQNGDKDCLSMTVPSEIWQTKWDIILVDGPPGHGEKPGRMKSIFLAFQLASQSLNTDVFIHDCNRHIEKMYSDYFFTDKNLVDEIGKLRHYRIHNSNIKEEQDFDKFANLITNTTSKSNNCRDSLIAGVSMVKDEEDIIYYSLEENYRQGIDKFVILDNLSSDQTVPEIKRFMKDYPDCMVYLIEDRDVRFHKCRKMSAAAEFAYRLWDVEWIFPFDADEVIDSESRPLYNLLSGIDKKHICLGLAHKNYVLREFYDYSEPNPLKRITYRKPQESPPVARKVLVRWQPGMEIVQGHHCVKFANQKLPITFFGHDVGVSLRHYRYRSFQQIRTKIINGGLAYQATTDVPKKTGSLWKERYKEYLKKGEVYFDELYQSLLEFPQKELIFDTPTLLVNREQQQETI